MRLERWISVGALLLTAGCSESPVETARSQSKPLGGAPGADMHALTLPACTHHWANAVSGSWFDASKWNPATVPDNTSSVCIDAAGTYSVTLTTAVTMNVDALQIGGASGTATLLLTASNAQFQMASGARIGAHGVLEISSQDASNGPTQFAAFTANLGVDVALQNDGIIRVTDNCSGCVTDVRISNSNMVNNGLLDLKTNAQIVMVFATSFTNTGIINVTAATPPSILNADGEPGFDFNQQAGSITGSQSLLVSRSVVPGNFNWTGGTLGTLTSDPTRAVVNLHGMGLLLGTTALSGNVYLSGSGNVGSQTTLGDVGPAVHLRLEANHAFELQNATTFGNPVTNFGTIEIVPVTGNDVAYFSSAVLINAGTLSFGKAGLPLFVVLGQNTPMTLTNTGTIVFSADANAESSGNTLLDNAGTITVANGSMFTISGTNTNPNEFRSQNSGIMTGQLQLSGFSKLTGVGHVGDVSVLNSQPSISIAPGLPVGTLAFNSLMVNDQTTVTLEVGGSTPGTFDQLAVAGQVTYSGPFGGATLNVINNAPFLGGVCGQVIPLITDNSTQPRGAIPTVTGLSPGAGRAWRTYNPPHAFSLVGYDPTKKVSISPTSIAVAEGGPAASYNACLSTTPTANVTVTASPNAQVTLTGSPIVFPTATWQLPKSVNVTAVNDAVIEPPQSITLTHSVSSGDPNYNNAPTSSVPVSVADDDGSTDLVLTITVPPPPITVGPNFNISFRSKNNGPTLSTGATFFIPAPLPAFRFVSATGAVCTANASGVTCQLPGVASGGQVDFTLTARAIMQGTFPVTMQLTAQQSDANLSNNTLVRNLTVH